MPIPNRVDRHKLEEVALALLHLTSFRVRGDVRAWKGLDWELLDLLHEHGWIADPKSKAKSVTLTKEGAELASQFFEKHFGT